MVPEEALLLPAVVFSASTLMYKFNIRSRGALGSERTPGAGMEAAATDSRGRHRSRGAVTSLVVFRSFASVFPGAPAEERALRGPGAFLKRKTSRSAIIQGVQRVHKFG